MKQILDYETARFLMSLHPSPCILCGSLTMNRGQFVPDDPRKFGVGLPPPGKTRLAIYALCERHTLNEETIGEIVRRLKQNTH